MQASCAVPSLRKPVEIDGQLMADGGVICNLPVKQCRELGADFVIAVDIDQPFKPVPLKDFRKPGSVAQRMLTWGLWDMDEAQAEMADIVIHPNTDRISLISTKKSDARRALKAGEEAAQEILPLLREKMNKLRAVQVGQISE
jgi:NTE family protein